MQAAVRFEVQQLFEVNIMYGDEMTVTAKADLVNSWDWFSSSLSFQEYGIGILLWMSLSAM